MSRVHLRTCHLCEAMCGVRILLEDERVVRIEGDPDDPFSKGHICPKAVALQDLQDDPDRLRQPMRRTKDGWAPMDWDAALDFAAEGLDGVRRAHGKHAVGVYLGNPNVHDYAKMLYGVFAVKALGTKTRFSATSVDQLPHHFVSYHCFGHQLLLPIPDVDRTDFLLMMGANPAASNGSLMSAGDIKRRIKGIGARGGTVVLVDPRRTPSAALCTEHQFIRPGTDALLLASLLWCLFDEDLVDENGLPDWIVGVSQIRAGLAVFSPEAVSAPTGIPADTIRSLARRFAAAPRAVAYGRMGLSTQAFGATCQWLLLVLNAVTGNLDRAGGAMFTKPAVDIVRGVAGITRQGSHGRWTSRVRGLAEFGGELPVATLAEEISTPGKGQVRGMLVVAGNPVLSTPAGHQLDKALDSLDFMVSLDPYINETSRHASIILPPSGPLSRDHFDLAFNALAVRNVAKWSPPMCARGPGERHDWEILIGLEARLSRQHGLAARISRQVRARIGPTGMLDFALRTGPYGGRWKVWGGMSMATLKAHPHGLDLGALEPALPGRLYTTNKRVLLAPDVLLADLPRLREAMETPPTLVMIGRRELRSNNSWMHNSQRLVKGKPRCTLHVHPDDADRLGLRDGADVRVRSRVGEVVVPVAITDTVMAGVVCLPHGWGHGRQGVRMAVASAHAGVSMNDLTDPLVVDAVSGNAVLNGVPVEVSPA